MGGHHQPSAPASEHESMRGEASLQSIANQGGKVVHVRWGVAPGHPVDADDDRVIRNASGKGTNRPSHAHRTGQSTRGPSAPSPRRDHGASYVEGKKGA